MTSKSSISLYWSSWSVSNLKWRNVIFRILYAKNNSSLCGIYAVSVFYNAFDKWNAVFPKGSRIITRSSQKLYLWCVYIWMARKRLFVYFRSEWDFDVAVKTWSQLPKAREKIRNIIRICTRVCMGILAIVISGIKIAIKTENDILRCSLVLLTSCS